MALILADREISYWDLDSETRVKTQQISGGVKCALNCSNKILIGFTSGKIKKYNILNFDSEECIQAHAINKPVNSLISYGNDKFISCSQDKFIRGYLGLI